MLSQLNPPRWKRTKPNRHLMPQLHDHDHDHDDSNDDEISGGLKDAIGEEEFEIDEDLVGKFWRMKNGYV